MCGITAIIHKNKFVDSSQLETITDSIRHRGPDDFGYYIDELVGIGHRRLSILDLSSSGHQPMKSSDGRYVIAFNGEIYNYLEIKEELLNKGYFFNSTSDTEVLLNAYIEWGKQCLQKLNGMWAFIVYDKKEKTCFIARDRFGVKPLYYYKGKDTIIFGSEIKTILSSKEYLIKYNNKKIAEYVYWGKLDTDECTFYNEIFSVLPGTYLKIHRDLSVESDKYWEISNGDLSDIGEKKLFEQYFDLFEDSVKLRMRSDVPIGICLSGGLDSTSIMCSMNRLRNKLDIDELLEAFTYIDRDYDENSYINDTLQNVNARLNKLVNDPVDLFDSINEVMYYHDEPVHSITATVGFKLFKMIKNKGIKVILNGQGADESLAGYSSYFETYWLSLLIHKKYSLFYSEITQYCKSFHQNKREVIIRAIIKNIKTKLYNFDTYKNISKLNLIKELQFDNFVNKQMVSYVDTEYERTYSVKLTDDLKFSMGKSPLPLYLRVEDRNSMANSTEVRLPFMDYRLINTAFSLPDNLKIRGPYGKYLLRKAMDNKIPTSVSNRLDKMGFPTSFSKWTTTILKESIVKRLHQCTPDTLEIFNLDAFLSCMKNSELSEEGNRKLFRLIQIDTMFVNNKTYN